MQYADYAIWQRRWLQAATGMFANDDKLAKDLITAGEQSHDRIWQLPLWEDYQSLLDSNFADMQNIGGRAGGTITAAGLYTAPSAAGTPGSTSSPGLS